MKHALAIAFVVVIMLSTLSVVLGQRTSRPNNTEFTFRELLIVNEAEVIAVIQTDEGLDIRVDGVVKLQIKKYQVLSVKTKGNNGNP
jgi:hypothetical protein